MIPAGAILGAFLAVLWGIHHPALGILACFALVLLAVGLVRFCREIAPSLSVASWPPSFARPPSLRPSGEDRMRPPRRRPAPVPPAPPASGIVACPKGSAEDFRQLLAVHGAVKFAIPQGHWCYLLIGADGLPFYPGITRNLMRRLGEHLKAHGARIADIQVIKCGSEHEARVLQFVFADRFDHCIEGFLGTADYERYRAELHRAARTMDLPAHITAAHERRVTTARSRQEAS